MINRVLIRTRALQVAYAQYHSPEQKVAVAEAELQQSLRRTYDLYLYLLVLPIELTKRYGELIEVRSRKHLASEAERNPNRKLLDNKFISHLEACDALQAWYTEFPLAWSTETALLRHLLNLIEGSSIYQEYLSQGDSDFTADRELWVQIFHSIIASDAQLAEYLEAQSLYWDDELTQTEKVECEERPKVEDIEDVVEGLKGSASYASSRLEQGNVEIVKDFVLKSLRRAEAETPFEELGLYPMYKDGEEATFASHLLRQVLLGESKLLPLIDPHISDKWERERLADMDLLILRLATVEFLHFPTIPTSVTINEYVELAKRFSTPKSGQFVNGVLDAIAKTLKAEGKILKQ